MDGWLDGRQSVSQSMACQHRPQLTADAVGTLGWLVGPLTLVLQQQVGTHFA